VRLPYLQQLRTGYSGGTIALSPDGGPIAYVARRTAGRSTLMLRDRDALEPRTLEGTDGADAPFFSPDGAWVGYTAGGRMYKVPTHGGAPMLLTDSANANVPEAHWNADHTITFTGPPYDIRTMPEDGACSGDPAADADKAACLTGDEQDRLAAWIAAGAPEGTGGTQQPDGGDTGDDTGDPGDSGDTG
jgi:hypothetical protein